MSRRGGAEPERPSVLSELSNSPIKKRPKRRSAEKCKLWMNGLFAKRVRIEAPEVTRIKTEEQDPFDLLIGSRESKTDPEYIRMQKEFDEFAKFMKEFDIPEVDANSAHHDPLPGWDTEQWEKLLQSPSQEESGPEPGF